MKIVGMYIHQHWPYKYPYAARTWSLTDWRGYLEGIAKLGYNTVNIWPMLEIIPKHLTVSDREHLLKIAQVIDMAHNELGMCVIILLCPNIIADDEKASRFSFQERQYFNCAININPAMKVDIAEMISWRKSLLGYLKNVDKIAIIDSDPGGYPDSSNEEYVNILLEHRKMFDSLRPGIELIVWLHAGWAKFCQFYKTGNIDWETTNHSDFKDVLQQLKKANPEPWGIANGLSTASELGLDSRVINFSYGAIEPEPSFPLTKFDFTRAYEAGKKEAVRGVIGNAQTHCVQLPNTFAFAQGALNKTLTNEDYLCFAEQLTPDYGESILECWKALGDTDPGKMLNMSDKLENAISGQTINCGPLGGLLFNDAQRFLTDLVLQLRYKAGYESFSILSNKIPVYTALRNFVENLEKWQSRHKYEADWEWYENDTQKLTKALKALNSKHIENVLSPTCLSKTSFEKVREKYLIKETFTPRFIKSIRKTLSTMSSEI